MEEKRNKGSRRFHNSKKKKNENDILADTWKPEKNWKMVYLRSEKLKRASQLGNTYPRKTLNQVLDEEIPISKVERKNILFVCSRNQWRSPTAETVWKNSQKINVRSAGTSPKARKTISVSDIQWSDIIVVMEKKHKNRIIASFTRMVENKPIYVLDIEDNYKYMDSELVESLKTSMSDLLDI